jgi:hypothetical protein
VTTRLSQGAGALAELLRARPRPRVSLRDMWRLLDRVDPARRTQAQRRQALAWLLNELAGAEVIMLPADRAFDRGETPHLPLFVTVARTQQRGADRGVTWHPELAWVNDAELPPSHIDRLEEINVWLFTNTDPLVVPTRERSLEIFGHEKTLDSLLVTDLFEPGRLSLATVRARRAVPPLHTHTVGDGDLLLVVENSDTFDSIARALAAKPGRVGMVGWGAGAGFEASVLSTADLGQPVNEIRYFGDLDRSGLHIPARASEIAVAARLPAVQPAVELYSVLLRIGRPRSGQPRVAEPAAERLVAWLDPTHRDAATHLLTSGHRLAQEAVGLSYLRSHDDWRPGGREG